MGGVVRRRVRWARGAWGGGGAWIAVPVLILSDGPWWLAVRAAVIAMIGVPIPLAMLAGVEPAMEDRA